ncbi:hypothetical protein HDU87_006127 [Geranomyces variabilis]|uniref:Uncharacterized protein n=1 Tax=Geranomyces variabilis TaxID=109894 RepID=A0AAD5XLD3_9FUNG|nr:hypothetical protein HDU87_006127 [Geranomyces variabilis]
MTLKHPTRDIDGVKTADREYPADYLWPQNTAGMETEGNRVVPALTRSRPSTKRGLASPAEPLLNAKRRKPVDTLSAAPAAERSAWPPRTRNAAQPQVELAAQAAEPQRSAPLTQTTMILTPRATPAPGTSTDHDDGMPVQSQASSLSCREIAVPLQQQQSQQEQPKLETARPGKRRAIVKREPVSMPAGSASSPHAHAVKRRKTAPAAGRGGAASITELAAIAMALGLL